MKIIPIILLISFTFSFCFAELQISDSIKNNAKQANQNHKLDEKYVMSIIKNLLNQKIIKNVKVSQSIYPIPEDGSTDFIKLKGRINEFGRTAQVNLEITKPDGTLEKITSPLLETGTYSSIYPINSKSQIGTYKVQVLFFNEIKSVSYFHLTKNNIPQPNFPSWIQTTFVWWAEDKISDSELINSVQHLVDLGLIVISEKPSGLTVEISGDKMVRRGTTHTINVHVTEDYQPLSGAKVTLTIEDYGENIIREFNGFTDQNGFFVYSWEIPKSYNDYKTLLAYISVSGNGSSQTSLFKFQVYCLPGTINCKIDGN